MLIGGQAVAIWTDQLASYLAEDDALVTSADIDFQGPVAAVREAARLLDGTLKIPTMDTITPHTGLTVFVDGDGYERTLDFLESPHGLTHRDVEDTAIEIVIDLVGEEPLRPWVMHPASPTTQTWMTRSSKASSSLR